MAKRKLTKDDRDRAVNAGRALISRLEDTIERIKSDDDPTQDIEAIERARVALRGVRMQPETIALALILEALHQGTAYERRAAQIAGSPQGRRHGRFEGGDFCVVLAMAQYAQAFAVEKLPLEPELWVELMSVWRIRPGPPTKADQGLKGESEKWLRLAGMVTKHWSARVRSEQLKSAWRRWVKGPDHLPA